jgi:hypothetical protein
MKRLILGILAVVLGAIPVAGQNLEDLNIQIHGYATQGFLYTTNNNILTTNSSNGSPAWTEAVVNVTAQPDPKLRVGIQARYFILGNYGNAITLDWAAADYKASDKFGVRFGKVKTPSGLFNEVQDIDPSYIWSLLPQGVYPIGSRNSLLAHYGGVVYGNLKLGEKAGKIEYRGWGGEMVIPSDDGYLLAQREVGLNFPNGIYGPMLGAALHWKTPLAGLMLGASDTKYMQLKNTITAGNGALSGTQTIESFNQPFYYAKYEKNKIMVAGEYSRLPIGLVVQFPVGPPSPLRSDTHSWYGMASYKVTEKFTAGLYQSQSHNHGDPLGPGRYSKDWTVSGRYDFNQYLYAKAEQHFIDGTTLDYDMDMNPNGLKPDTRLTILKIGVSF